MVWQSYLTSEAPCWPQVSRARAFGFAEIFYDMLGSKKSSVLMVVVEVGTVLCTRLNFIVLCYLKVLSQLPFCLVRFSASLISEYQLSNCISYSGYWLFYIIRDLLSFFRRLFSILVVRILVEDCLPFLKKTHDSTISNQYVLFPSYSDTFHWYHISKAAETAFMGHT